MSETINTDPSDAGATESHAEQGFLIVGIGASAGGIQALKEFFARVPAGSGMAYVVILHLSPDHDSQLAEVLQSASPIPVTQIQARVRVEPNHVYVIPPNKNLAINDGLLDVSNLTSAGVRRAPVDIFFRTLAESHRERAVAVVLSGTGANGSMGIKRVKERGGCCIVQDPREAEYADMPQNALATGLVDCALPVAAMPAKIIAYRDQLKLIRVPEVRPEPPEQKEADEAAIRDILTQLRVRTGHDFSSYKRATVLRRIGRRMGVHELSTLPAYARFIHEHPQEATALLKDLLISVTNFFRDAEAFEALGREIVPKLFAGKAADDQVRVWVAGCATGEEAYTLAMMLADYRVNLASPPQVQIFATDIDEEAIAVARDGTYTLNDAADIPPERLSRYFVKEAGDAYRVRREIRERVLFAVHNVIKDPPFSHLDLVTCRNLLIYLNQTAQRRVMDVLHFALNPGGYLMLGASETVDGSNQLFAAVDKEHRIYQGRAVETRLVFPVPEGSLATRLAKLPELRRAREARPQSVSSYSELHHRLLERYAPPSVVVNEDYDIVHMSETAGRFMEVKGGEPSANLLALIRPELRLNLRTALYQATQKRTDVESRGVAVRFDGETTLVDLLVRPVLSDEDRARGFILVIFREAREAAKAEAPTVLRPAAGEDEPLARQLEAELLEVRAQLSATIEQHELQREELKASNEELQAMNEEMRSAAEELETSKEELQSINEELTTVNQDLKIKIEELAHSNDDFKNLMNSTQIGTVFLDRNLRVKLFTPRARDIFNLIPADVGRPLSDITSKLEGSRLIADAEMVLERLHPVECEARTADGRVYLSQIVPYRTADDRINGVILSFFDITQRRHAEEFASEDLRAMKMLRDLAVQLTVEGDTRALYGKILDAAVVLTRADAGSVQILAGEKPELVMIASKGLSPEMVEYFERVNAGSQTSCGIALATGVRAFINFDSPEAGDEAAKMHVEAGYLSAQSTPLIARSGRGIGMLTTHWRASHRRPTEREQGFLDLLARQAADLIEQRESLETIRLSAERYRALFDAMDEGFCTVEVLFDENGKPSDYRFLQVNPSFERHTGIENAAGKRMREIAPHHEDYWFETYGRVAQTGKSVRFEHRAEQLGRWFEVYAFRVEEPRLRHVGILFKDITERRVSVETLRRSEQHLRSIVDGVTDYAIITQDAAGVVESWNVGAERMFGYAADEMIGRSIEIIFTPEDRAAGVHLKEMRTAQREGRASDERWHVRKDGSRFYVSGVMSPLGDITPTGYVKIARDLTPQKQAGDALHRAYDELEARVRERTFELAQANESLRDEISQRIQTERERVRLLRQIVRAQEDERRRIARDIHDQLGQQMTALRLSLAALEQGCGEDAEVRRKLEQTKTLAERLDADVDFLAWELRPAALDDIGLAEALGNYVREWSKHSGVGAQFHTTGMGEGRLAPETETNLYRITQEALNNTMKYARATRVDVLLERRDHHVVLIVEDDGVGFDPKQVEGGDGDKGMGLVGMRERAALVGGKLEIESKPKEGTTIFARVPVKFLEEEAGGAR